MIPENFFTNLSGSLQVLDLSRTAAEQLPHDIGDLGLLVYLLLAECKNLSKLPKSIRNLHSVKYLGLTGSGIRELPEELGNLHHLNYLNLRRCHQLEAPSAMPPSIGKLQHSEYLDLSHCIDLDTVPGAIGKVTSLKVLKLPSAVFWKEAQDTANWRANCRYYYDAFDDDQAIGLEDIASCSGHPSGPGGVADRRVCRNLKSIPSSFTKRNSFYRRRFSQSNPKPRNKAGKRIEFPDMESTDTMRAVSSIAAQD